MGKQEAKPVRPDMPIAKNGEVVTRGCAYVKEAFTAVRWLLRQASVADWTTDDRSPDHGTR